MFKSVNESYNAIKGNENNNKLIVESVMGDELIPFSSEEDEAIVDVDSIDKKTYDKIDKLLDKIVTSDDYDDDEIDGLIDDDDDEEIDDILDSSDISVDD